MIPVSKAILRFVLARKWRYGLTTRPTWSTKWRFISTRVRNVGGAWECEARNAPESPFDTHIIEYTQNIFRPRAGKFIPLLKEKLLALL